MKISRELNLLLNKILNDFIPPILRDQRWFGSVITRILYKDQAPIYLAFHERVYEMSDEEFADTYRNVQATALDRPTNLNHISIELILQNILGNSVLEVGCGRGHLVGLMAQCYMVTGCDVALADGLASAYPAATFVESPAEKLPFGDKSFDTVISTHMLEHVRDLPRVLAELRRVAAKRLIVVVPCERPHFYTPNLHVHFFPYRYSLLLAFQPKHGTYHLQKAGGDWFYYENLAANV